MLMEKFLIRYINKILKEVVLLMISPHKILYILIVFF
jgi:hypothetical protein